MFALYGGMVLRAARRMFRQGRDAYLCLVYGVLLYTSKVPEFVGAVQYWRNALLSREHRLIEYK